jgi:hypothetical protein
MNRRSQRRRSSGALGIAVAPWVGAQIAVQLIVGLGVTVFPAATAAFALGLAWRAECLHWQARRIIHAKLDQEP